MVTIPRITTFEITLCAIVVKPDWSPSNILNVNEDSTNIHGKCQIPSNMERSNLPVFDNSNYLDEKQNIYNINQERIYSVLSFI